MSYQHPLSAPSHLSIAAYTPCPDHHHPAAAPLPALNTAQCHDHPPCRGPLARAQLPPPATMTTTSSTVAPVPAPTVVPYHDHHHPPLVGGGGRSIQQPRGLCAAKNWQRITRGLYIYKLKVSLPSNTPGKPPLGLGPTILKKNKNIWSLSTNGRPTTSTRVGLSPTKGSTS